MLSLYLPQRSQPVIPCLSILQTVLIPACISCFAMMIGKLFLIFCQIIADVCADLLCTSEIHMMALVTGVLIPVQPNLIHMTVQIQKLHIQLFCQF